MSPLAHVVQVAIVGGALVGVLVMLAGTATVDYLKAKARAASVDVCGWCGGGGCDECDPDRRYPDDENDLAEEYADILDDEVDGPEYDEPDWGAEWDRARDRDLDYRAGAA